MHFFYLDESGDTGRDLNPPDQPVMVLGGVNLRDEGWNKTQEEFTRIISRYFGGKTYRLILNCMPMSFCRRKEEDILLVFLLKDEQVLQLKY